MSFHVSKAPAGWTVTTDGMVATWSDADWAVFSAFSFQARVGGTITASDEVPVEAVAEGEALYRRLTGRGSAVSQRRPIPSPAR